MNPIPSRDAQALIAARQRHLGKMLSLSYREPLKIVRGSGVFLYDEDGREYLDCVNNVCHVGHCHPRVVEAAARQMAALNTNTRYLHDNIVTYAKRLTATLPGNLSVCFFVNSGSEANDLALRLARNYTKRQNLLVLDQAYHGHTASLIAASPYKFDSKGGSGAPAATHILATPDTYRGPYRCDDPQAAARYANQAQVIVTELQESGEGVAAVIAEPAMGCGGQIILPDGYLSQLFTHVRAGGGACIADEVQVGFGRVGSHAWCFQTQNATPDILTLGKPIGNGHPLGAVVTTPEIAESFNNGMEYFNTFGGNPVSCAIGLEVLQVIEDEELQQNALETGNYLMAGLRGLAARHDLIGDVRGLGLFIGVELVRDRQSLEPADSEAETVIEGMKARGVLLSSDGPHRNVLKIKPPIVFSRANADRLVTALDAVLSGKVA